MSTSRILVDFNELVEPDLVLLSKTDEKFDSSGAVMSLFTGQQIRIYSDDIDNNGLSDNLIAEGIVELNISNLKWTKNAKWCCRINALGTRSESEVQIFRCHPVAGSAMYTLKYPNWVN
jgi:hypothetical protein